MTFGPDAASIETVTGPAKRPASSPVGMPVSLDVGPTPAVATATVSSP